MDRFPIPGNSVESIAAALPHLSTPALSAVLIVTTIFSTHDKSAYAPAIRAAMQQVAPEVADKLWIALLLVEGGAL
ncbi:MAG: hypothetical protein SF123_10935 [Chloroflexota bacterium]|nr:hypothetical protein [Chloroflexota bacterium]